jgi:DNA-binding response OmpR family regulator
MRVLVAEDDRQMSQLLCAMLRSAGHQATPAFDGASAMMAAMRAPLPELIVLDLNMPAGTGQVTLMKLKQSSRTTQIPVLVVSAEKDPAKRAEVMGLGAAYYLEKPVSPDNFIAAIEAIGPTK